MALTLDLVLDETPLLRAPVLLAAFAGWGDGAVAGSAAVQYLISKYQARRLGIYDPDDVYEYTSTRPVSILSEGGSRELIWPTLALYACSLPDGERDALILAGPEPNLHWRALAGSVVSVAQRFEVSDVVVLGSYWDRVSHLGRALLSARAADAAARAKLATLGLPESGYQGPTGFTSALLDACAQARIRALGLSGRAPHYVQGVTHPKIAHALLQAVEQLVGLRVDIAELERAGREQERLLTERVKEEPRLWQYAQQLAAATGQTAALDDFASGTWQTLSAAAPEAPAPGEPSRVSQTRGELPSGKDLVDAVEEFLRSRGSS